MTIRGARPSATLQPTAVHGVLFGLLSMLGPLAIDFYLPAFPEIARDLSASPWSVKLSLGVFIAALATGPMLFGTLSDRLGRRPVLFGALALFGGGSLLCAMAPTVEALIGLRILQGLGACALTVMSRAMIRDVARGDEATSLLALAFLVQSISPLFAPMAGGALLSVTSWRMLFVIIAAMALCVGLVVAWALPETHGVERRTQGHDAAWRVYALLLQQPRYLAMCLIGGCATAGGFGFLTAAPFVIADGFGKDEHVVGLLLAGIAIFQIIATQLCPRILRRHGLDRHLALATGAGLAIALSLAGIAATGLLGFTALILLMAMMFWIYGMLLAPAAVGALDAAQGHGGAAAALFGTIQLSMAALASVVLSISGSASPVPLIVITVIVMIVASAAAGLAARHRGPDMTTAPAALPPSITGDYV